MAGASDTKNPRIPLPPEVVTKPNNHGKESHLVPPKLGGGFKYFLLSSLPREMIHFDEHIFQVGWNHQLENMRGVFYWFGSVFVLFSGGSMGSFEFVKLRLHPMQDVQVQNPRMTWKFYENT